MKHKGDFLKAGNSTINLDGLWIALIITAILVPIIIGMHWYDEVQLQQKSLLISQNNKIGVVCSEVIHGRITCYDSTKVYCFEVMEGIFQIPRVQCDQLK